MWAGASVLMLIIAIPSLPKEEDRVRGWSSGSASHEETLRVSV